MLKNVGGIVALILCGILAAAGLSFRLNFHLTGFISDRIEMEKKSLISDLLLFPQHFFRRSAVPGERH